MSGKIALILFTTSVLLTSFIVGVLPQALALTQSTWDDSHTTARFGNSKVCGDHLCGPGEHARWVKALNDAQRSSHAGRLIGAQHGEDILLALAAAIAHPGTSTQEGKPMTGTMAKTGNMTMPGDMNNTGTPNGMG
jgi:hypothetical protein